MIVSGCVQLLGLPSCFLVSGCVVLWVCECLCVCVCVFVGVFVCVCVLAFVREHEHACLLACTCA